MTNYRDEYKSLEVDFLVSLDKYQELAAALGFKGDAWFGDPLASHTEIVAEAKRLKGLDND